MPYAPAATAPENPLRFQPDFEQPEDNEAETGQQLMQTMRKISETVYQDEGHAHRSVHAKSHGLLTGTLTVAPDLPAVLAQGLFATPGCYDVVMRLSTVPGDLLADSVSTPRGLAVKVIGVPGERLYSSDTHVTQDFVMVNAPTFATRTARQFARSAKLLAATTDKAEGLKSVLSATLRGVEAALEKFGGESPTLLALGGQPTTHILGESFYTQAPLLYGPYIAKMSIVPVSPGLTALTGVQLDLADRPNGLRDAVQQHFAAHGGVWALRVQLCTNLATMPIEDASVRWPEADSPYITVARIEAMPQPAWNAERSAAVDDGMAFSPWHCLAAHRPLGSIMRARRAAYEMAARFRSERNARKVQEPTSLDGFPS